MIPSEWDKSIEVGDIITAYHDGYHRLDKIELRFYAANDIFVKRGEAKVGEEYSPLFHYTKVMSSNGKKFRNGQKNCCDASYCKLAYVAIHETIMDMKKQITALEKFQATLL